MHCVRVGLELIPQLTTIDELRAVWWIADESGFDHCWVYDHFLPASDAPHDGDVFEGWTLLGAMAVLTSRVRIGALVTGNTYRHPGVLAKIATTVDHLSGGRLEVGIGAGWAEREHVMLDLPYGTPGLRIDKLDEACRILKQLWTEEESSFEGRHYRLVDAISSPKPLQRPHPPLWVGGRGERKLLRGGGGAGRRVERVGAEVEEDVRLSRVLDRTARPSGATRPGSDGRFSSTSAATPRTW